MCVYIKIYIYISIKDHVMNHFTPNDPKQVGTSSSWLCVFGTKPSILSPGSKFESVEGVPLGIFGDNLTINTHVSKRVC